MIVIYSEEPNFPATDQHPSAIRYFVGEWWVDSTEGEPSEEAVDALANPQGPLALQQVACVRLTVDGWDVTGIERSSGISLAFVADTDTVWAFFDAPQPDTEYIVVPDVGVTKYADYLEITKADLATVALIVQRVQ